MNTNEAEYLEAEVMSAVALTYFPEIGKVVEQLKIVSVEVPKPNADQVAIKLMASSMHADEIYAAQGTALGRFFGPKKVSAQHPYVLGSSVSGVVVAVGENVTSFEVGDEVIAVPEHTIEHGSWATYRCVNSNMIRRKPSALSHVEAAAITMASCVGWGAIGFADVKREDRCLIIGASGAIGNMVLQFLKSLDVHVTAVCSYRNDALVRKCGADVVVDYTKQNFADEADRAGEKYDAVFDCVGGREIERDAFRSLKSTGKFVTVVGPKQHIGKVKLSWSELVGIIFYIARRYARTRLSGPRYIFGEKYPRYCIDDAMASVMKNQIRMPIDREIPFQIVPIKQAVQHMMSHRARGRIVINFELQNS